MTTVWHKQFSRTRTNSHGKQDFLSCFTNGKNTLFVEHCHYGSFVWFERDSKKAEEYLKSRVNVDGYRAHSVLSKMSEADIMNHPRSFELLCL